jgi:hypothetical protein
MDGANRRGFRVMCVPGPVLLIPVIRNSAPSEPRQTPLRGVSAVRGRSERCGSRSGPMVEKRPKLLKFDQSEHFSTGPLWRKNARSPAGAIDCSALAAPPHVSPRVEFRPARFVQWFFPSVRATYVIWDDKMLSDDDLRARLLECFARFKMSGFTQATLSVYLDEMRATGSSRDDVELVNEQMQNMMGSGLSTRPGASAADNRQLPE